MNDAIKHQLLLPPQHLSTFPLFLFALPLSFWKKTWSHSSFLLHPLLPVFLLLLSLSPLGLHFTNYSFLILNTFLSPFLSFPRLFESLYRRFKKKSLKPFCSSKYHLMFIFLYNLNSKKFFFLNIHFFIINYSLIPLKSNACSSHLAEITSWAYTYS